MATDLERFVSAEGRDDLVAAVSKRIKDEGITYVYYQFVSVTGRIMGKGIPAEHWETNARKGYQLVYGATANLFTDRHGNYIGYGAEEAELVGDRRTSRRSAAAVGPEGGSRLVPVLPRPRGHGDRRAFLTADCRGNLKRIAGGVRGRDRAPLPGRHRARDDVAQARRRRRSRPSRASRSPTATTSTSSRSSAGDPRRGRVRPGDGPRHELRRPRGRARPARAQLPLRPRRADGRQHHDLPPDLHAVGRKHGAFPCFMPKPFTGVSANGHHHHFTLSTRRATTSSTTRDGRRAAAEPDRPLGDRRHPRPLRRADVRHGTRRSTRTGGMWDFGLLGAGLQELGLAEPHDRACASRRGPLRVPRRGLAVQPVPDHGGAARGGAATGSSASSTRASPQERNTYDLLLEARQAGRASARDASAPRSTRSRPTRSSGRAMPGRPVRACSCTTSATSGSATCAAVTDWEREEYLEVLP